MIQDQRRARWEAETKEVDWWDCDPCHRSLPSWHPDHHPLHWYPAFSACSDQPMRPDLPFRNRHCRLAVP